MNRPLALLLFVVILLSNCGGPKKLTRPMEEYKSFERDRRSIISIPIELGIKELEASLNKQLNGVIYDDQNLRDDNLAITATKNEEIKLQVDSQVIRYTVPLDLQVAYDAGFTTLRGTGEIAIEMETRFGVRSNWALETQTSLIRHEWLRKPSVSMAGIKIPIGFVANLILNNGRRIISRKIDQLVAEQFKMDELIKDTWQQMYEPLLVSPEYNTWVIINPKDIAMSPIFMEDDSLQVRIVVEAEPEVHIGLKPRQADPSPLPIYKESAIEFEGIMINIGAQISYEEAERLAKDQIVGETYTYGKRSVTVENIELFGKQDKVIVNTELSGSYSGNIFMEGRPVYNVRQNKMELKDLDFTLDTRSFLFRSAGWLLKGPIKKGIQDNMNFLLEYNLKESQQMVQSQLDNFIIAPGVKLRSSVNDLSIREVLIIKEGLYADIFISGDLKIVVDDLSIKN